MDLRIVVNCELCGFVVRELLDYSRLVFGPARIFQRCDIEKDVLAFGVELSLLCRIELPPSIPNFLQVSLIGGGTGRCFASLRGLRGRCRSSEQQDAQREGEKFIQAAAWHTSLPVAGGIVA